VNLGTTEEPRGFTQQHHDMRGKPADIFALTPPSQDEMSMDVNVKGPGGMTPLMLAAMRGSGLDTCEDEHDLQPNASDDEVAHMIQDLLMHGSKLDEASDVNGETALHFAARCARAAVVKLLLDNGADVTLRDHNGRTALHSAVAAGSSSVLAVLKMHRKVDWNARMSDGTTPLILAVRLVINGG
jgi:ankyrin repeat protein